MNLNKTAQKKKESLVVTKRTLLSPTRFFNSLRAFKSADWSRREKMHLLSLFKRMALDVPAYRRFLGENGVRRDSIRTVEDLTSIPVITKKNYLQKNAFAELLWNGSLRSPYVLTSTSGSTGKPTYFARSHEVD